MLPKRLTETTAEIAPKKLPIIKFLGWARKLSSAPKIHNLEEPKGSINNDWSLLIHTTAKFLLP